LSKREKESNENIYNGAITIQKNEKKTSGASRYRTARRSGNQCDICALEITHIGLTLDRNNVARLFMVFPFSALG
jgi:hypothetical protein